MKKTYQHISTSSTFFSLVFIFLTMASFEAVAIAKSKITSNPNMDIIAKDTVLSSKDCYAYDVVLKAYTADLCYTGTTDWTYLIINADSGDTIQYSWNYNPLPGQGVAGDEIIDRLTNTNDASFKIMSPIEKGIYRVIWHVSNQCGDEQTLEQSVRVLDKTPPVAFTYNIYTCNGQYPSGLLARSLDKGGCGEGCISSWDNCTSKNELYFTYTPMLPNLMVEPAKWMNQYAQNGRMFFDPNTGTISTEAKFLNGSAHAWYPELRTSSKFFLCESLDNSNAANIKIYVWDEFALPESPADENYGIGYAYVYFSNLDCYDNILTGRVLSYKNDLPVPEFLINLTHVEGTNTAKTDYFGNYEVEYPNTGFTVEAYKEKEPLEGITTLDLVIIQKYLLGLRKITDPYCIIAADINLDGKISAADLLQLRKWILGLNIDYKSWIGIKKGYIFQDPLNPFKELDKAKKYEFRYEDLNDKDLRADFTGIKIGEMNCIYFSNRNEVKFKCMADDIFLSKGKRTEITIYAKDAATLDGMQFSIGLADFSEFSIESGKINISQEDYSIVDNKYIFSYIDANGLKLKENDILFTLIIETDQDMQLSSALRFAENTLAPEVYSGGGSEISEMQLEFRNTEFKVFEPFPNPFYEKTSIDFTLTEDANYNFVITDLTARKVSEINAHGKKGINTINLTKNHLQSGGIYLYKLNAGNNHKTGKLVYLDK